MNDPIPKLLDSSGRPFPLERKLASGGEGAVFTLPNDATRVAKIYHRAPSRQTVEKLTAMVQLSKPALLDVAAWPKGLLLDARTREPIGFVMPHMVECQPIQHIYNPIMRSKHFPKANWAFQIRVAKNAAAAFDEVHKAGCLVGDVNQSNALVTPQALVKLIDCDSFQVRTGDGRQYLCEVGVPQYTPPELQGGSFRGLVRTENHDRFGLAVLIYQLLFVGRHPYMGIDGRKKDSSFEEQIAAFRFSQGPNAASWQMSPPPHTPTLADIPTELGMLFRRAFEPGSEKGSRASPGEWIAELTRLEKFVVECSDDPGHKYWIGRQACVWCRLAERGGPEFYYGVSAGAPGFALDVEKLQEVRKRLAAVQPVEMRFDLDRHLPKLRSEAEPLPENIDDHRTSLRILAVAVLFCLLLVPLGLIKGYIAFIGFVGALIFGTCLTCLLVTSPLSKERRRRNNRLQYADDEIDAIEKDWTKLVRRHQDEFNQNNDRAKTTFDHCMRLGHEYDREKKRLVANAEAAARLRHLRLHSLIEAEILNVGTFRKETLLMHGISTAADIEVGRIRNISGFGPVLTQSLLDWRDEIMRGFRFDPNAGIRPPDEHALSQRLRLKQKQLMAELDQRLAALEAIEAKFRAALKPLEAELRRAAAAWDQADADHRLAFSPK